MGNPINHDDAVVDKSEPETTTTPSSNPPNTNSTHRTASTTAEATPASNQSSPPPANPAQLPPAALELASKLFDLARTGDTQTLSSYLTAGVPPNLTNHAGDTLLMLAAYHNHLDTVRLLLSKGADANALNDKGQSPLAGAVFKGYEEVVRVLVEEGGADSSLGRPSAIETAGLFKREACARVLGVELGEGGGQGGVEGAQVAADLGRRYALDRG